MTYELIIVINSSNLTFVLSIAAFLATKTKHFFILKLKPDCLIRQNDLN